MRVPHVYTVDEIHALPEFGAEHGWFYGLVRDSEEPRFFPRFSEILPGIGYTNPWPMWYPHQWWLAVKDLLTYRPPSPS